MRWLSTLITGLLLAACLLGCAGSLDGPARQAPNQSGVKATGRDGQREVVAIVNGEPIPGERLSTELREAVGGLVLSELVLDRMIEVELRSQGLEVTQADLARERSMLNETLGADDAGSPALLAAIRSRRGLGPTRLEGLVRRSAGLRTLAASNVEVTPEEIDLARRIRFGERREIRVIVTNDPASAARARQRVTAAGAPPGAFSRVAREVSVDPSAARGGLLDPISVHDPAYPRPLRRAIADLGVGEVTAVIPVEDQFAVARLEGVIPPPPGDEPTDTAIEAELRRRKERVEMERIATRLMREAEVTVLDPALHWSWEARRSSRSGNVSPP